jgi:hypothetical protein
MPFNLPRLQKDRSLCRPGAHGGINNEQTWPVDVFV